MPLEVKICGLTTPEAISAVIDGGASFAGFVFYPPTPRNLTPEQAAELTMRLPGGVNRVGLFVDPSDDDIAAVRKKVFLDLIQLHGDETPERVIEIKQRNGLPIMKAIKVASSDDLESARAYESIVDRLLFDAKAPEDMKNALPGGNAHAFEWRLMKGASFSVPWVLAGGLTPENLRQAVAESGATSVDVSSGVEESPGRKDPKKIQAFLDVANTL